MKRQEARDRVYKIIFQINFHDDFNDIYERLMNSEGLKGAQREYAKKDIEGIIKNKDNIDETIKKNLKDWAFSRLSNQVIAALRLGIFEIIYNDDIPAKVALKEAVDIAHIYCDEKEANFVNGLLHNVYTNEEIGEKNE